MDMMFTTLFLAVALLSASPCPKHIGPVRYPVVARLSHTQGIVIAHISLDSQGRVAALSTEGHPMLADAAKKWVNDWTFETRADIVVEFRLTGQPPVWPANAETIVTFDLPDKVTVVTEPAQCDHCE
jgi:Gram-negative bacterial TonB protein C-terminal